MVGSRRLSRGIARALALAATSVLLGVSGCLTVGKEFPARPVTRLEVGKTTREEVREWFGIPWRMGMENGQRTWTYGHYRYSLFGAAKTRDLVCRFDADGVLASYNFNTTQREDLETLRGGEPD
jgi:outer membrane protein assembly factor BamE (lipoprotein component of BamABCDE complex)